MDDIVPTPPGSCGLAIALPTSLEDVERALRGGPYQDYVSRGATLGDARRVWDAGLSRSAAAISKLAEFARGHGVRVKVGASAAHVTALFETCRVVTVLAHWRGPELSERDLRLDPLHVVRLFAEDESETAALLRQGLPSGWRGVVERASEGRMRRSRLAEMVDARLQREPALLSPPDGAQWYMDPQTLRHFNRDCLDAAWPQAFVPGNRLELADGLHTPAAITAMVPESWQGVADLSSCQSAQLIEEIKQGREDRVVVANESETNPLLRMAVLQTVYAMLAAAPRNYADVRRHVAASLSRGQPASR